MKLVSKNNETMVTGVDIHGRLEALDQTMRSLEGRLRAVERRLSGKGIGNDDNAVKEKDIYDEIEELINKVDSLSESVDELKNRDKTDVIVEIENKIEGAEGGLTRLNETTRNIEKKLEAFPEVERRLAKLENANKITIGKIKVPVELSGLVAAFVLLVTGFLIFADRWDIIRNSTYPISIGILFGIVVIIKFVMTNRETG